MNTTSSSPAHLLVVDDNVVDRRGVMRELSRYPERYLPEETSSGTEAIQKISEQEFDLVLMDYKLGDMKGMDVIEMMAGKPPFILITGSGSEDIAARAIHNGVYDYVIKDDDRVYLSMLPATIDNVLARIRAEAAERKLLAELKEALASIRTLQGLLPICSGCKKIRNDTGYWEQIEAYISKHSDATFTHSLCPACEKRFLEET